MNSLIALTIDVEDYFQIHALSDVIRPEEWDGFESRVEENTHRILDLLDSVEDQRSEVGVQRTSNKTQSNQVSSIEYQASSSPKATFFVVGWVAQRFPALVREIHARGHEVACHGYDHQLVSNKTHQSFRKDVARAKQILEDLTGVEVIGYRAPSFSITKDTLWALEILSELGFRYDSSIFPIKHDFYGLPGAPRYPFFIDFSNGNLISQLHNPMYLHEEGKAVYASVENSEDSMIHTPCPMPHAPCPTSDSFFIEFPLSTISLFGLNLPCSGGGYFRLLPYWFTRMGLKQINKNKLGTAIFYLHPWELDPDLPIMSHTKRLAGFRTYVNQKKTEARFTRLLSEFRFAPLASFL